MNRIFQFVLLSMILAAGITYPQDTNQPRSRFSGYMIGDYYYNIARDTAFSGTGAPKNSALSGAKDMQGFQFRRIYLTYDNDISDRFTSRFRLEADQSALTTGAKGTDGDGTYDGKIGVFVKDAYLKWTNVFEGSDLLFGIQPTTAFEISEAAWGYRSLEKTILDLRGIIPARDFGVALRGKISSDGIFNYWAMIANGDGNKPAASKFKRYSLTVHIKPDKNWQATLLSDYRAQASIADPGSTSQPKATVSNDILTVGLFLGYKETDKYALGVEGFLNSTFNGYTEPSGSLTSLKRMGISLWGSVNFKADLALMGRYDYFDPNTDGNAKGDTRNYIIGGLSWKPEKNISIIPNFQVEMYESTANGKAIDASVSGRITLYYVFL